MPAALALRNRTRGNLRAGIDLFDGRSVVLVSSDAFVRRGALAPEDGATMREAAALALKRKVPLVLSVTARGADPDGGLPGLHGWGMAARALASCSGIVPVLAAIDGPAVSGTALLLGLMDHVVMTRDTYAFVSGPTMVESFTGERLTNAELGGAAVHGRQTGAASLVVDTAAEGRDALVELLRYLPDSVDAVPPLVPTWDPVDRPTPEAAELLPQSRDGQL